jgi:hypothetical protein
MTWIEFFQYYLAHHLPATLTILIPTIFTALTYWRAGRLRAEVTETKEAVTPNHGSSMRDAVDRIETYIEKAEEKFAHYDALTASLTASHQPADPPQLFICEDPECDGRDGIYFNAEAPLPADEIRPENSQQSALEI